MPESGKRLTAKAVQPLQGTKSTKTRSPGSEGMNYPVRKMLTPPIPALESKTPETKEGGQPKDSHREKLLLCSSDFCNGRGICTMQGELRKCNCLMGYSGDFCEEAAHGPAPGHIAPSLTIALLVVLVILGAFVYFRREQKLKRWAATFDLMGECYSKGGLLNKTKIRLMRLEVWIHCRNFFSEERFEQWSRLIC